MTKKRVNTATKKIMTLNTFLDACFLFFICVLFYLSIPIYPNKVVIVPQGSLKKVFLALKEQGVDINSFDMLFLRLIGMPKKGYIDMGDGALRKGDFLVRLIKGKTASRSATLIPGETRYFFTQILSETYQLEVNALNQAYESIAPRLNGSVIEDGVILPDTYHLPLGESAFKIMQVLINQSLKKHEALSKQWLGYYHKEEWFEKIILASIVQKEAANIEEMPIVASVILNRLKKNMPLQMDGSLNYQEFSHTKITKERIRTDNTPYNTYKFKGLPKNPVGSVSVEAIKAVVFPKKTNFLYFVKMPSKKHAFSTTYKEHLSNIKISNNHF
ncbi:endolytic transglycosylase MltG [Helicobacter cetorum]|uniref:Endolytic murein transglycosylase n=1 Tax=Helicobacter cetorum (strain ATCC BAA-540 / CCUG 52418 / MIT 99-5656) TaxID=1163745 RepID=I0EQS6_HELCM|nr:endolytic transglycosylase MltG [Helicobacter cetorum]AFI05295.1 aminodeoxychorismate lyase [Helicobacter cetorum MIT 99-5656]